MNNRITKILGTQYPLILGPMRLITLGGMAALVSNSGGFGQIAASGADSEMLKAEIKNAKKLTDKPFGINMPLYRPNAFEALEIAIEMGIKTVTTSAGNPAKIIGRIKEAGLKVLHKVSTVKMALKAQEAGVDGVIATGFEAGGHVGRDRSFAAQDVNLWRDIENLIGNSFDGQHFCPAAKTLGRTLGFKKGDNLILQPQFGIHEE